MSTIDQAFVQAFARRNRKRTSTATVQTSTETSIRRERTSNEASGSSPKDTSNATHWIDPAKDNLLRMEAAAIEPIPAPHVQAAEPIAEQPPQRATDHLTGGTPSQTPVRQSHQSAAQDNRDRIANASASGFVNEETYIASMMGANDVAPVADPSADSLPPYISAPINDSASKSRVAAEFGELRLQQPQQQNSPVAEPVAQDPKIATGGAAVQTQRFDSVNHAPGSPHFDLTPAPAVVQAAWEVDEFDIPASVSKLFFKEELFETVAQRLHDAVHEGLGSILVTSARSGEGRSTVAIGMALAAAASGIRVALIDGDVSEPTLVDDLRLDVDYGWYDATKSGLPFSQVAVYSIEDNLTLIPLVPAERESAQPNERDIELLVQKLVQQFDLIVVDAPSADQSTIDHFAALMDSAVIARDASRTDVPTINTLSERLRSRGLQGIGIVENFV